MTYLAFVIASILTWFHNTSKMTGLQGLHMFLNYVVDIQRIMLWISVGIWVIFVIVVVVSLRQLRKHGIRGGCVGAFGLLLVFFLPLIQWWMLHLCEGLLRAVTTHGIINPTHFWLTLLFLAPTGIG